MSNRMSKDQARRIVQTLTDSTKKNVIVNIRDNGERLTRYANSEIHQNVEIDDTVVTLTLWEGKKSASCQTNVYDKASLEKLAADTEAMLAHAPEGEDDFNPPPNEKIADSPTDFRLPEKFDIKGRAEALKLHLPGLGPDYTAAGVLALNRHMNAYGDCGGVFHYNAFDSVEFEVVVTHKDGETGFAAFTASDLGKCDIAGAVKAAHAKAKAAIGPSFAELGPYTVVLESAAVANLVTFMLYGLNAGSHEKGLSFASGLLGQKLFGENITIRDDVSNPATLPMYFDAEGYKRQPLTLIEKGVVKNVVHCSKTAKRAGVAPTGHAIDNTGNGGYPLNVVMEGGDSSLPEMIKGVKKGILVTHFHYCNFVNPKTLQITGLTRDGTFMIEDGRVKNPIRNMRFTQSLLEAFSKTTFLSKTLTPVSLFGGAPALFPAAVIEDFHFTSGQK